MPIATTTALIGASLVASVGGTVMNVMGASKAADAQKDIIAGEQQVEAQRRKAMELDSRRKITEQIRMQQRANSMALANANNQGASQGSGLQGGYGQIAGATGTNILGVNQNLEIGQNIFGINANISQAKMQMADAQTMSATGSGLTSFGGSLMNSAGAFGKLSGGFPQGFPFNSTGQNAYRGWA